MIDDLDRIMTDHGTISIKTPDVWGQDRLAKFRSEYEAQMAGWLKQGFKGDINASVRHTEVEATQVQVGANIVEPLPKGATAAPTTGAVDLGCDVQGARRPRRQPRRSPPRRQKRARLRSSPRSCSTSTRAI